MVLVVGGFLAAGERERIPLLGFPFLYVLLDFILQNNCGRL
jgi:hypothetical protein